MKNILLLLLLFVLGGCIDDNGNYEYNSVRELKVLDVDHIRLSQGESVTLTPKVIVYKDPTETPI